MAVRLFLVLTASLFVGLLTMAAAEAARMHSANIASLHGAIGKFGKSVRTCQGLNQSFGNLAADLLAQRGGEIDERDRQRFEKVARQIRECLDKTDKDGVAIGGSLQELTDQVAQNDDDITSQEKKQVEKAIADFCKEAGQLSNTASSYNRTLRDAGPMTNVEAFLYLNPILIAAGHGKLCGW